MKKRVLAVFMVMAVSAYVFAGCSKKNEETVQAPEEKQEETFVVPDEEQSAEEGTGEEEQSTEEGLDQIEAIGDIDVDKNLFDVTITVPKDFIGETTQEELDAKAKEKGFKSATLNSDGSVTYVMTKAQHKEMLEEISTNINNSLAELVESDSTPNITDIKANDNFTSFTITTKNEEPDLAESFMVLSLYMYGGMYAIFSGDEVDNIHVDYVNATSGEIISSADSKDMGE